MSAPQPGQLVAAAAANAEALAAVHAEAFDAPWRVDEIAALMESPGVMAIAAWSGAGCAKPDPLGFILGRAAGGEGEILTLAVRPACRRGGVGSALVAALVAAMRERSVGSVWLEVAADNLAAQALYRGSGFETTGRRRGYYARPGGERADALMMQRVLNTAAR